MLSAYTTPKPLHPFYTALYVANLQGLKPPQSRYILLLYYAVCCQHTPPQSHYIPSILSCMLPTYRAWNQPKAATSLFYTFSMLSTYTTPKPLHRFYAWPYVANLQSLKPTPIHLPSILCCMFSTYTIPKPLHPFYTGLYVANLQGLKPPQSRYILLLYYAVCCRPTPPQSHYIPSILGCVLPIYRAWSHPKAATFFFYTMLYVVSIHHPKATTSLLYWAVCCQSTGPEATPKPLHSSSILCCMLSTYTTPKPLHPFYTGLYVANLQGLKPPQSRYILLLYYAVCCQHTPAQSHIPSILGCMLPTYRAWKPRQSRYIPLLYYAVCCQPKPPQSHCIPSILGCMLPTYRASKPNQSRYSLLYTMLSVVNLHQPKATTSLRYWAVCCQPTGSEAVPKPLHSPSIQAVCCQPTGSEAIPKPLHSPSILCCMLPTYRAWNQSKGYIHLLKHAVCFQATSKPLHPVYTGLYVANLQDVKTKPKPLHSSSILCCMLKATVSLLYLAVCCQPTGPEATPKPLHSSSILCRMLSTYTTPKPLYPFYTGLYVSNHPKAIPKAPLS